MVSFESLIPTNPGLLPKWLVFISAVSFFNSAQTYFTGPNITRQVYAAKPAETTGLSSRTFGTWTLVSAVIRFYGGYYISNPQVYQLTFASYTIALLHFASEWLLYGTTSLSAKGSKLAGPFIVATTSLIWMWTQWDYYVSPV